MMRHTLIAAIVCSVSSLAAAQTYPAKAIRLIVPFAPGGNVDITARAIGPSLAEALGQQIIIDNRGGAGGNIAGEIVAKSAPDGYTLFMTSGSIVAANQHIYRKMPFDPEKDFVAVTGTASGPQLIAVNPSYPAKTLKDFIAAAKAKPKALTFGSAGHSTQTHLAGENFMHAAGIDAVHIPYKGEGPALTELVAGQLNFMTPNMAAAIGFVQQGKLRALAITSKERAKQLPDVPAVAETLPGFENIGWFGIMAPAGTPPAVVRKIHEDVTKILQSQEYAQRLAQLGMVPYMKDPDTLAKSIKEESAIWSKIVKARNLTVN